MRCNKICLQKLKPSERNYRQASDDQLKHLDKSPKSRQTTVITANAMLHEATTLPRVAIAFSPLVALGHTDGPTALHAVKVRLCVFVSLPYLFPLECLAIYISIN